MSTTNKTTPLFSKENFILMLVGGLVIALGMFLMSGGKSADPNVFSNNEVYSSTRITVAPILIVVGLLIEVYAIFKKPKTTA
jgi:uncharacterized membrane protein